MSVKSKRNLTTLIVVETALQLAKPVTRRKDMQRVRRAYGAQKGSMSAKKEGQKKQSARGRHQSLLATLLGGRPRASWAPNKSASDWRLARKKGEEGGKGGREGWPHKQ